MNQLLKDESGITALETAIILIAFVVVATVFAFPILQAGIFATERGSEDIYSGIQQASASMKVVDSVKAVETDSSGNDTVNTLTIELRTVSGGSGVDMGAVIYSYIDPSTYINKLDNCTSNWLVGSGSMLEADEMVEIVCDVETDGASLGLNTRFQLEVKPDGCGGPDHEDYAC